MFGLLLTCSKKVRGGQEVEPPAVYFYKPTYDISILAAEGQRFEVGSNWLLTWTNKCQYSKGLQQCNIVEALIFDLVSA